MHINITSPAHLGVAETRCSFVHKNGQKYSAQKQSILMWGCPRVRAQLTSINMHIHMTSPAHLGVAGTINGVRGHFGSNIRAKSHKNGLFLYAMLATSDDDVLTSGFERQADE